MRRFVSILSRLSDSCKFDIYLRGAPNSKTGLLHKPGFPGHRSKVLKDRKVGFYLDRCIKKALFQFPSTHDTSNDGPTIAKGYW